MSDLLEAVVIGSGFGGAIAACRLGRRWPGQVVVLERGRRYPMGSFARSPHDFSRAFWNLPEEKRSRPSKLQEQETHGLFDVRNFRRMDAVLGAGLGGGSLIYANVFMEPPDDIFDDRWPQSSKRAALAPYYGVVKSVLGSRPIPPATDDPRRRVRRAQLFEEVAREVGRESALVDINVFFGNDFNRPLPIGHQERNRYGAVQTSCTYCAECCVGCNGHAKNTLDLNYLFSAEQRHGVRVLTEHLAERVVPLDDRGDDDPAADGRFGYRVSYYDLTRNGGRPLESLRARRVVVSAGTLGSTELLLRCRDVHRTLPRLNGRLGHRFSGNGDFLAIALDGERYADSNYGPVITQRIDFNLFKAFDRDRAFMLQDASLPPFAGWFVEGVKPRAMHLAAIWRTLRNWWGRFVTGVSPGNVGWAFEDLLSGDVSYQSCGLLCMGIDRSNGLMSLDPEGRVTIDWPYQDSWPLYQAIVGACEAFATRVRGRYVPLPTWFWPSRRNVTVHALGGCVLAADAATGVTDADPARFGQVFGYPGLYVSDGAIAPSAVGANPTATISALAERVAEGITGLAPDEAL
jgi:cholesterol oxidase